MTVRPLRLLGDPVLRLSVPGVHARRLRAAYARVEGVDLRQRGQRRVTAVRRRRAGSYQSALEAIGIPGAKGIVDVVVLVAVARFLTVIANYPVPEAVFTTLLATSGAIALLVYLVIAVSQLRLRAKMERDGTEMPVRMWAYPWLTWAVVIVIPVMLVYMATREASRFDLAMTALIAVVVVAVGVVTSRRAGRSAGDLDLDDARADRGDRV